MSGAVEANPALWIERQCEREPTSGATGGSLPLALLHGWGLNLRVFDGLRAGLTEGGRELLYVDLPGHGRSGFEPMQGSLEAQADQLLAALPQRFELLGWSLGGQIALAMARRAPARVARLILVATTPKFVAGDDWSCGLRPELLAQFAAQLERDYRLTVSDFLELQVRGSRDAGPTLLALQRALLEHGEAEPAALRAGLEILRTSDARPHLVALAQPALVIAGQYDRVTPPAACRALAAALPNAEYLEFARASHAPFLSHTDDFVVQSRRFLEAAA